MSISSVRRTLCEQVFLLPRGRSEGRANDAGREIRATQQSCGGFPATFGSPGRSSQASFR